MKIIIVIPTYNEANNIKKMTEALFNLPFSDQHLIIVDDASPDGTGDIANKLAAQHPQQMTILHRSGKQGLGTAYAKGFQTALDMDADVIVQMDADFSHSPKYIPEMVKQLETYDVVVGSRYVPGGQVDERWSWWRYLLSWWANQAYARLILGIQAKDATAGFKAFRRRVLEEINVRQVVSNGYVFQVEIAHLCQKMGFSILELPIYFEDRRIGKSKMSVPVKVEAVWRVWQIYWRHRHVQKRIIKDSVNE
ncbi:MAG: polyprenol monophosphomannose synthase [Chloroflexi bacterium]|nr:polyprenol monophosphomannose synthase [Chloroflexota bacterium]